jgi:hypothetical protein
MEPTKKAGPGAGRGALNSKGATICAHDACVYLERAARFTTLAGRPSAMLTTGVPAVIPIVDHAVRTLVASLYCRSRTQGA